VLDRAGRWLSISIRRSVRWSANTNRRHQKRTTCMLKHRPIALIEEQIEEHYRQVQLNATGLTVTGEATLAELGSQRESLASEHDRQHERLKTLDDERLSLLRAHYAGAVPIDLLKREQSRITTDIKATEQSLLAPQIGVENIIATTENAVHAAEDCRDAYLRSGPIERCLMNQAFFEKIFVTENGISGWEYSEPFQTTHGASRHSPCDANN
jgi:site-specific DNA recombinase